jgi:hypothetical protein
LHLARKSIQANQTAGIPVAYNLVELHQYAAGHLPTVLHRAMPDVRATIAILFYNIFWENRGKCLFSFGRPDKFEAVVPVVPAVATGATVAQGSHPDDSNTSVSDSSKNRQFSGDNR